MVKVVAVIGAGVSGLTAIKACKEEGIDVVCFEKSEWIGGLWHYHDDTANGKPSVMQSTVINTHKEMTAFSDFPPPDEAPNYMHNSKLLEYLEMYANHFDLKSHIRFQHEVLEVMKSDDFDLTGQWKVVTKSYQTGAVTEEKYDGVMVCSGHHAYESWPTFPGQDTFKGRIAHSHSLKNADAFRNLNVLVVGIGNSGVDCAVEISNVAKQVYISTRRGAWIIPRCGLGGLPFDASFNSRIFRLLFKLARWDHLSWLMETLIISPFFNHNMYGLEPKHRFLSQHPTINDHLPSRILAGRIIVKRDVDSFTCNGVRFEQENSITPIDAVVFATGYKISFPFIKEPFADIQDNKVNLYKLTFPPYLKHPSLAFIGLNQPMGSIMPISEVQSRWFALVMNGKVNLPRLETMLEEIRNRRKLMQEQFVESPRHTIQVDYVWFMDDLTSEFGAKPSLFRMMFADPMLFMACLLGPCLPYQYRLQGPHSWPPAREAILKYPTRVTKPLMSGLTSPSYSIFQSIKAITPIICLILSILLNIYLIISFLMS